MKIGIDIRTLMDKNYSGVSLHTFNLVMEILKQDKENEYILYYNSARDISDRIPKFKQDNVKIVNSRYPNKIFNYILQKIFSWPKLDKVIGGVDIFLSPHINFSSFSKDCKNILVIHDLSFLRYQQFFSFRKNIWHRFINVKKKAREADLIITVSENTKNDVINLLGIDRKKVKTVHPGLSSAFKIISFDNEKLKIVKEKYNLSDKFILCVSTIEPRKNIEAIIRAFNEADLEGYELVIAGGVGWKSEKVFYEYERSAKKNKINFLGYIDEDEKVYLYNLASFFVFPSLYEGFGFPPLEAQKCGTAVIASNIASVPEVLGDSAVLINPDDINSLKIVMEEILKDDDLKNKLIEKGLENIKKFTWQKTAEEYINNYV